MKITIVSGARPNFMKIAPICRAIDAAREAGKKVSYRLVYTGPQDDPSLDASLFSDLSMRKPDAYLGVSPAKGGNLFKEVPKMRVKVTLACTECKQRNYDSKKNKKNDPDRLEMNKYCPFCRKHTLHRETK